MKKIKSFTVIELIVGLLISSIVISLSYYAYFLFSTQVVKQQNRNNGASTFQLFKKTFQNDFTRAAQIKDTMDRTGINFEIEQSASIKYLFQKDLIIRTVAERSDTFNMPGKINKL